MIFQRQPGITPITAAGMAAGRVLDRSKNGEPLLQPLYDTLCSPGPVLRELIKVRKVEFGSKLWAAFYLGD